MPTSQQSITAAFSKSEVGLVKGKAKGLIGKHGFTIADLPDIEQELFMEVFLKRNTGKAWSTLTASQRTILSRILDNRIRKMVEAACADKRRVTMFSQSLNTPVGHTESGDPITLLDLLADTGRAGYDQPHAAGSSIDLRIDLSLHADALSNIQVDINVHLSEGRSITEIARILGIKRTTLHHELARIRVILEQTGMTDYA